jgi:hypothetical protein
VRFLFVLIGLLVIIFAWAGKATPWAAIVLTVLGVIQIITGLSQKHSPAPTPPPPPPPPRPAPEPPKPEPIPKPEPAEEAPEEEVPQDEKPAEI